MLSSVSCVYTDKFKILQHVLKQEQSRVANVTRRRPQVMSHASVVAALHVPCRLPASAAASSPLLLLVCVGKVVVSN